MTKGRELSDIHCRSCLGEIGDSTGAPLFRSLGEIGDSTGVPLSKTLGEIGDSTGVPLSDDNFDFSMILGPCHFPCLFCFFRLCRADDRDEPSSC